jgi:hypothetical protein
MRAMVRDGLVFAVTQVAPLGVLAWWLITRL